jgi:DNA-binding NarL/FixJ family response regulator
VTALSVSVLVVDDSRIVRERLCALLAEDDRIAVVGEAGTAGEACVLFQKHRPDAVILDVQLPDHSGLEVLAAIKWAIPSCRVIMLTNACDRFIRRESQRRGADHFLRKATEFELVPGLLLQPLPRKPRPAPPS